MRLRLNTGIEVAELLERVVSSVISACYRGVGLAADEGRGIRRIAPKSGRNAEDTEDDDEEARRVMAGHQVERPSLTRRVPRSIPNRLCT
jgi:hypothetical protein